MKVYTVTGSEDGLINIYSSFKRASDRAKSYVTMNNDGGWQADVLYDSCVRFNGESANAYVESWYTE